MIIFFIFFFSFFFSVVEFSSKDDMKRAMRKLDDEDFKGRRIRIREVKKKPNFDDLCSDFFFPVH